MSNISRFYILLTNRKADHLKPWQVQIVGYSFASHVGRMIRKKRGTLRALLKEAIVSVL